jgi:hypothetical protein
MQLELELEEQCYEPLQPNFTFYRSRFAQTSIASCDLCGYKAHYWECQCELNHECNTNLELED